MNTATQTTTKWILDTAHSELTFKVKHMMIANVKGGFNNFSVDVDGANMFKSSIAFKAAQMQDKEKAILFLREIREMVFLLKKNITKWEHMEVAANKVGLNVAQLKADYAGKGKELFQEDLKLGRELGVRGFPTMFFVDEKGNKELVYGSKPYSFYEGAVLKLASTATKTEYKKNWEELFSKYPTLTAKEFSELSGMKRKESEDFLNHLTAKGNLEKRSTKNGSLWKLKNL